MATPELKALGRYTIQRVLGRGAMGVVYEGLDPKLNRRVAIKTILRSHLDEATAQSFAERFVQEAHAVARLNHPHIVQVHDFGEEGDIAYLVMEFIRGRELQSYFNARERFEPKEAVRIMDELASALEFAHQAGVIHRDVKPANVMLDSQGHTKLTDFGVARVQDVTRSHATQAGTLVGTPAYMSPEQITGMAVDRRTDVFAAGIILYQFLTGELPFSGGGPWTIAKKIMQDQPALPSSIDTSVSPLFDAVVGKALAKEPDRRYQSMRSFAVALKRALEGKPDEDDAERTVVYPAARAAIPSAPAARAPTGTTQPGTQEAEVEFWRSIKDSSEADDYELYLKKFPEGLYADLARRKMSRLGGGEQARREAQAKLEAEARAREVEENARRETEEEAKRQAAERTRLEAEQKKRSAEEKARLEAEARARETEEKKRAADEKAKREAEALLRKQQEQARKMQAAAEQAIVAPRPGATAPEDHGGSSSRPLVISAVVAIGLALSGAALWYATKGRAPEAPQAKVEPTAEHAAAAQKQAAERAAADKLAADKAAVEKLMAEARAEAEKAAAERAAAQKAVTELAAAERAATDRAAASRLAGERAAAERVAAEKAVAERQAAERAAAAKLAAERSEVERAAAEKARAEQAKLAATATASVRPVARQPTVAPAQGDSWTYEIVQRDQPRLGKGLYIVRVLAAGADAVLEGFQLRDENQRQWSHTKEPAILNLGVSIFSPYPALLGTLLAPGAKLSIQNLDSKICGPTWSCQVSGRVVGPESVRVPAGSFEAIKVEINQNWTSVSQTSDRAETVSRTLTVWYVPQVRRAVKFASRGTLSSYIDTNFDLELVSYQLK